MQDDLSPGSHINDTSGDGCRSLRNIKTTFKYIDKAMIGKSIRAMLRYKVGYPEEVLYPAQEEPRKETEMKKKW